MKNNPKFSKVAANFRISRVGKIQGPERSKNCSSLEPIHSSHRTFIPQSGRESPFSVFVFWLSWTSASRSSQSHSLNIVSPIILCLGGLLCVLYILRQLP
jgi:hypothetical protein